MYFFYIVRCKDNSLYCGQTNDLVKRVSEHNSSKTRSAKYTKIHRPVSLAYFEKFETLQSAMKREWQVKKWSKKKKEALVFGNLTLLKKL